MDTSIPDSTSNDHDVYPTHFWDNVGSIQTYLLAWTLLFNDSLDTFKLRSSLNRLLQTGDWRRLSGRLKRSSGKEGLASKQLEIHVSKNHQSGQKLFGFTHEELQVAIEEHPLAAGLASTPNEPSLRPGPVVYRNLAVSGEGPKTLEDILDHDDVSLLTLHIVSFTNATLVTVTFPHLVMDGIAFGHFLRAWSHILAGDDEKVAHVLAARTDLLAAAAKGQPATAWKMHAKLLSGVWLLLFTLRYLWNVLWDSKIESKIIFLPQRAMDALHEQAMLDISQGGQTGYRISKGDVLLAWCCQMLSTAQAEPRSISATSVLDIRPKISSLTDTTEDGQAGVYIQNMFVPVYTPYSVHNLQKPLGQMALQHREALLQQGSKENVKGFFAVMQQWLNSGKKSTPVVANLNDMLLVMSNRVKLDILNNVDFSPAVVKHHAQAIEDLDLPGIPVYQHSQILNPNRVWRNIVVVTGKDHLGGYWLTGLFTERVWKVIERELERLSAGNV